MFNICHYHEVYYLNKFLEFNKWCCNPYSVDKKKSVHRLQEISLELVVEASQFLVINLIPGNKLCSNYKEKIDSEISAKRQEISGNASQGTSVSSSHSLPSQQTGSFTATPVVKDDIDACLDIFQLSPMNLHGVQEGRKSKYLKRKLDDVSG